MRLVLQHRGEPAEARVPELLDFACIRTEIVNDSFRFAVLGVGTGMASPFEERLHERDRSSGRFAVMAKTEPEGDLLQREAPRSVRVFNVPEWRFEEWSKRVEKLNRRGANLGLNTQLETAVLSERWEASPDPDRPSVAKIFAVELKGEIPSIDGWDVVGLNATSSSVRVWNNSFSPKPSQPYAPEAQPKPTPLGTEPQCSLSLASHSDRVASTAPRWNSTGASSGQTDNKMRTPASNPAPTAAATVPTGSSPTRTRLTSPQGLNNSSTVSLAAFRTRQMADDLAIHDAEAGITACDVLSSNSSRAATKRVSSPLGVGRDYSS